MPRFTCALFLVIASCVSPSVDDDGDPSAGDGPQDDTEGSGGSGSESGGSASTSGGASTSDGSSSDGAESSGEDSGSTGDTGEGELPEYVPNKFVTVDATGDGDGSEADPWTMQQAVALAVAGDVVQIGPGAYSNAGGEGGSEPAFGIANAGTAEEPIVFFAEHPAAYTDDPSLRSKLRNTNQGTVSPAPTLATHNYVIIDGLWFDYADGGRPSSRGIIYNPYETQGQRLRRLRFDRENLGPDDDNDNYNCIHAHRNPNLEITDSRFVGGYDPIGSHNESAITLYGSLDVVIEHNTFEGVTAGIFFKGSGGPGPDGGNLGNSGIVRFNRFISCRQGVLMAENEDPRASQVVQNLFVVDDTPGPPNQAIEFDNSVPPEQRNTHVLSNTIVMQADAAEGAVTSQNSNVLTNNVVRDNIVTYGSASEQVLVNFWEIESLSSFDEFDYNWYFNDGSTPSFAVGGEVLEGLGAWQAASGRDANSNVGDPMFVDAEGGDYRLADGSPAATASSSGGPVGCYIDGDEHIGIRNNPPY